MKLELVKAVKCDCLLKNLKENILKVGINL